MIHAVMTVTPAPVISFSVLAYVNCQCPDAACARTRRYYFDGGTDPASSQVRRDLPWVEAYGNTEDAPGRVFATL
ncbi:hypothetical protein GCM10017567_12140 [Amycolatopsis bullii]|uniref:Secreted protein n=1 Tax=Amycolatopsis bullii TaxID=941987 RepID=A0ABQ3K0R3_9PSEU|nr:hypothetical protein GCM10017567_12140 [Amycolatopsis bullii]